MQDNYFQISVETEQREFGMNGRWEGWSLYSTDALLDADKIDEIVKNLWKVMQNRNFAISFGNWNAKSDYLSRTFLRICDGYEGQRDIISWDEYSQTQGLATDKKREPVDKKALRKKLNEGIIRWNNYVNSLNS